MFENYVPTESEEQQAVFQWAEIAAYGEPKLDLLYHVPNGGLRNKATAARMKGEGVKAGVPDIVLPVAKQGFNGLYIELKKRDHSNGPTTLQRDWLRRLDREGYKAVVCYGSDEAIETIQEYLGITVRRIEEQTMEKENIFGGGRTGNDRAGTTIMWKVHEKSGFRIL